MEELKLISKHRISDNTHVSHFCIYEVVSDALRKKHGCSYILSQGEYSKYALEEGADKLISNLKDYEYEGKHNTLRKTMLALKYAACRIRISHLESAMEELFKRRNTDKTLFDSIDEIDINKF